MDKKERRGKRERTKEEKREKEKGMEKKKKGNDNLDILQPQFIR
jgi:hypothetical protein